MPELPEAVVMARQMDQILRGKTIASVEIAQPKILNCPIAEYEARLPGFRIQEISPFGKWIRVSLSNETRLMISLGMGGEILYFQSGAPIPEKSRFILRLTEGSGFFITLWWFGYVHLVPSGECHEMTDAQGPDPLRLNLTDFLGILEKRKGGIKSFLLNQKRIRGIGNFYIQEILFRAGLHPRRSIPSLSETEIARLFQSIQTVLNESIALGSSWYELDFFGKKGGYTRDKMSFTFQPRDRCPVCQHRIEKIRTGSTSQYICPVCQK